MKILVAPLLAFASPLAQPAQATRPTQAAPKPIRLGHELEEAATVARISTPSTFHPEEIPTRKGGPVLALCSSGGVHKLVASTLTVKRNPDYEADDEMPRFDVAVAACDAVFFVVGDVGLSPGPVTRSVAPFPPLEDGSRPGTTLGRVDLKGGGSLRREGNVDRYVLIYDDVAHQQVLVESTVEESATTSAVYVGDVNRDGFDDVVVDATWHYNLSTVRLFLSDATGTLREVAHHTTTGC